jgi:oxygen-independent coproporphyrinogen-3 oxidase
VNNPDSLLEGSPYVGYTYSYPHKSAYRSLTPPVSLREAWLEEPHDSLFLYLHVPFCEFRCGFCNLFTLANADSGWTGAYLEQLRAEARTLTSILPKARFVRVAIGGGTPTFLNESQLAALLEIAEGALGGDARGVPASCEASPATLTQEKARILRDWGVDRLSLGVQSFDDGEARGMGRPQKAAYVDRAIEIVRQQAFPILNLDLIYGSESQSLASWMATVRRAIAYRAEEIYLYPLYVRELTGLGRTGAIARDDRLDHYRQARDTLLGAGYEQVSMRMFCLASDSTVDAPHYCCQSDGMIGLGCGARSYTRALHYSSEFAVGRTGVRSILKEYLGRDPASFEYAHHGYRLDLTDQKRRYAIQGLLQVSGLSVGDYERRFGSKLVDDLPQLLQLEARGLAHSTDERVWLTDEGIERSDAIGPWLYSASVLRLMEAFECV